MEREHGLSLDDVAEQAHWRSHLATQDEPSGAVLVRIFAVAIDASGRVNFTRHPDRYSPRWEFAYYAPDSKRWLTVTWLSPALGMTSPFVDDNAGNCSSRRALAGVEMALPTSGHIAKRFARFSDVGWRGEETDILLLANEDDVGDVVVASNAATTWRVPLAQLDAPFGA